MPTSDGDLAMLDVFPLRGIDLFKMPTSDGDLAMLDVFPLRGIDLFKMPTSPMGINWRCSIMYPIANNIKAAVKLSGIEEVPEQSLIVVEQLISQVILGVDFLQQQGLVLDFTTSPVSVTVARQKRPTPVSTAPGPAPLPEPEALQAIRKGERERGERRCASWHPWKIQLQMRRTSV
ncbi:hypothetical protein EMCRGX_G002511 [Ephydatia muelleri]